MTLTVENFQMLMSFRWNDWMTIFWFWIGYFMNLGRTIFITNKIFMSSNSKKKEYQNLYKNPDILHSKIRSLKIPRNIFAPLMWKDTNWRYWDLDIKKLLTFYTFFYKMMEIILAHCSCLFFVLFRNTKICQKIRKFFKTDSCIPKYTFFVNTRFVIKMVRGGISQ